MKRTDEAGVALITALLATMLASALMAGMFAAIAADQRGAAVDRDQTQAYAAAHAGLEQLTSSLASLFVADVSPSVAQINTAAATPPAIPGFEFRAPGGADGSGYTITFTPDAQGNPQAIPDADVTTGPFTGFKGLITPYTMTVTARSIGGGSEVRLRRGLQTVAIPVFQFGIFSDSDLSIFAGGGYNFGGRVHTNGNLFLAAQSSSNVTFSDRITAVNDVIRNYLANGLLNSGTAPSFNGNVYIPTSASTNAVFSQSPNFGSVAAMPGSTANGNWTTISKTTFKSYVINGATGAKRLDLPLVSQGAQPVDLLRRPRPNSNENAVAPLVFVQRFYAQAGLRILLSDRVSDFTGLPGISSGAPVLLDGSVPAGYGPVDANHPPIARSIGPGVTTTASGSTITGTSPNQLTQIVVAAAPGLPSVYRLPPTMYLRNASTNTTTNPERAITLCKGKTGATAVAGVTTTPAVTTANAFIGCTVSALPTGGGPYTVRATLGDGSSVSAVITGTPTVGVNNTLVTTAAHGTAPFSPGLIWINNASGTSEPVTCEGYIEPTAGAPRFLNCRGLAAAPSSSVAITTSALANQNTGTIGGYIKIDRQDAAGNWTDVTMEILNLGIGDKNSGGTICNDPTPNAVIRIQRLRDNGGGTCTYNNSLNAWDWWPQGLYDTREGYYRDSAAIAGLTTRPMQMSGVIQYIALDMANLKRWLAGSIGSTGNQVVNNNGFIVYFSDRRGNHDPTDGDGETGEFGYEDFVNPTSATGAPDGVLQAGEDVNIGDPRYPIGSQQLYGGVPWNDPTNIPAGASGIYSFAGTRPTTVIPLGNTGGATPAPGAGAARVNKVLLFRRALKLINGGIEAGVNNLPPAGITVVGENPIYVHGNYNATHTVTPNPTWSNMEPNVSAAVIGDAVTILSRHWSDARSFESPNSNLGRPALTTAYRFAALAGKGLSFAYCGAACGNPGSLYGTDGGAANFLRMMEDWGTSSAAGGAQQTTHYRGSIVSLHNNRQAVGTYKFTSANNILYNAGARNFTFDIDFLTPALLPPGTPMFRDVNTLQFRQILRPNQ